jgi:hypothetical protein
VRSPWATWTEDLLVLRNGYTWEDLYTHHIVYVLYHLPSGTRYVGSSGAMPHRISIHTRRAWSSHSDSLHKILYNYMADTDISDWVVVAESVHADAYAASLRETELVLRYARECPALLLNVRHPLTRSVLSTPRGAEHSARQVEWLRLGRARARELRQANGKSKGVFHAT